LPEIFPSSAALFFFRIRFADRAEEFAQIQRAYMTTSLTTNTRVYGLFANRASFHRELYLLKTVPSTGRNFLRIVPVSFPLPGPDLLPPAAMLHEMIH